MENQNGAEGIVFNIQHYCIHDGPGIRTNIFLKGCPLRCLWCQNPESNIIRPQVMYDSYKCIGCKKCIEICPNKAIYFENGKAITLRNLCKGCGACADVCLTEARTMMGKKMTVDEVYEEAAMDKLFFDSSGGGITLTGGEVLFQPVFAKNILKKCKENGLHTAIETCGYGKWESFKGLLEYVDLVLYDIKHMDSSAHQKYTGVKNERILENLYKISNEMQIPIVARTPIVPGYNDSEENIHQMGKFLSENIASCNEVNLLPYHSMGEGKREQLEEKKTDFYSYVPDAEKMNRLLEIIKSYGIFAK